MKNELQTALGIARKAGEILMEGHQGGLLFSAVEHKGAIDLVTEFDRRSEVCIRSELARLFPQDAVLGEEGGQSGSASRLWCVDPLDGTTNFAHGFPFFCVSIALLKDRVPVCGVVHAPALDWTFTAEEGHPSCFNGEPLPELETRMDLSSALLLFGCGYDRTFRPQRYLPMIEAFMTRTQGLRRTGSAALDCCLVGKGAVDGYMEVNLHPWDLAAGILVARGAGALVTDTDGKEFDLFSGRLVLGRPGIHPRMMEVILENGIFANEPQYAAERSGAGVSPDQPA